MKTLDAILGPWPAQAALFGITTLSAVGLGLAVLLGGVGLFYAALPWIAQPFLRVVLTLRYNLRVVGLENVPRTGPVLLVSNHLSWFDGFFLAGTIPRKGTAMVNVGTFRQPILGLLCRRCGLIPVPNSGPKAQRVSIVACQKALDRGMLLGIFPEGQLSRTGMTAAFHRGLEVILRDRPGVVVIPVYLDNVWGSIMSFSGGLFFKKWPKGLRRTVVISYGRPIAPPINVFRVRQAVLASGVAARAALGFTPERPETIDPALPHFDDPKLGPLTASTADVHEPQFALDQIGQKPGTIGHPLPGVAIRAVDDSGGDLPENTEGKLQALVPGQASWVEIGHRGKVGREGFVTLLD